MVTRPTGVDDAIEFVWGQPETTLTLSQKESIAAALAKETDVVARRFFLAPLAEQWVGTLKKLIEPAGSFPVFGKVCLPICKDSQHIPRSLSA